MLGAVLQYSIPYSIDLIYYLSVFLVETTVSKAPDAVSSERHSLGALRFKYLL